MLTKKEKKWGFNVKNEISVVCAGDGASRNSPLHKQQRKTMERNLQTSTKRQIFCLRKYAVKIPCRISEEQLWEKYWLERAENAAGRRRCGI